MGNAREVEHITLEKTSDSSLGFSGGGLESDNRGELGIFVQETNSNNTIFWEFGERCTSLFFWNIFIFSFLFNFLRISNQVQLPIWTVD